MWLLMVVACGSGLKTTGSDGVPDDIADGEDQDPPVITFEPYTTSQPFGQDVLIEAIIVDEGTGVFLSQVWYKNETDGSGAWRSLAMIPAGEDIWQATLPGDEQQSGGLNYYLEAVDRSNNVALAPEEGDGEPYHLRLSE